MVGSLAPGKYPQLPMIFICGKAYRCLKGHTVLDLGGAKSSPSGSTASELCYSTNSFIVGLHRMLTFCAQLR